TDHNHCRAGLDNAWISDYWKGMYRLRLVEWAKSICTVRSGAVAPAVLAVALVTGCDEHEFDAIEVGDEIDRGRPAAIVPGEVTGRYIVQFRRGSDPRIAAAEVGAAPEFVYRRLTPGFAGQLSHAQLAALREHPNVLRIEPDQIVTTVETQEDLIDGLWGLDRVDQCGPLLAGPYSYNYDYTGAGVNVYVVDSGIDQAHPEFEGRAAIGFDALYKTTKHPKYGRDCDGHGTHVAGTIGAASYGVAKGVNLYGVRVLGCNGSGTWSSVIAGLEWVAEHHVGPAVVNMSLGGGKSQAVNDAVRELVEQHGVLVVVAAGNNNANACNYSPASEPTALTVGASDRNDQRASFSNHGTCVDMFAPGVGIASTWLSGGERSLNGTSMASPHVAGVAALYLQANPGAEIDELEAALKDRASSGQIIGAPNLIVYSRCSDWSC
ncbi:MAG TPA: S8 family peptidase, partial [Enhygromyxa sp.]|nr:S8 family peptidase [Enhygromyxa sp.]